MRLQIGTSLNLHKKIIILLLVLLEQACSISYSYFGLIGAPQSCTTSSHNLNQSNVHTLSITFILNNYFQCYSVLMVVSFAPITCSQYSLQSIQQNQNDGLYMDTQSANGCDWQLLNIPPPNNSYSVYITIFNFNPQALGLLASYTLQIVTLSAGKICFSCGAGEFLQYSSSSPFACQCRPCPNNYVGSYCQYFLQPFIQSQTIQKKLVGSIAYYYRIQNPGATAVLSFGQAYSTNSVYLYMQYESSTAQIAGPFNDYYISSGQSLGQLITTNTTSILIPNLNTNILLTVVHAGSGNASIYMQYSVYHKQINLAAIIGGIVGGVFAAILITVVVCLVRKRCLRQRSASIQNFNAQNQESILYEDNLNLYFPAVPMSSLSNIYHPSNNDSLSDFNQKQFPSTHQCIICLSTIEQHQEIRMTYCRHMFHAACLASWLNKAQNCPYCRREFSLKATRRMFSFYQKKNRMVKGLSLILAILDDRINKLKTAKQNQIQIQT